MRAYRSFRIIVVCLIIGLIAGLLCYVAVCLKPFLKYDDSLDAFGVHGVGGFLGAVLTGVLVSEELYRAGSGSALPPANMPRPLVQLLAALVAVGYTFVVTVILVKAIDLVWGFLAVNAFGDETVPSSAKPARRPRRVTKTA